MMLPEIKENFKMDTYKWKQVKPTQDICQIMESKKCASPTSSILSTLSKDDGNFLPKLYISPDEVTRSILTPELVSIIVEMDSLYNKFRRSIKKLNLSLMQFFEENFDEVKELLCPEMFRSNQERCELLRILLDYERHRRIIHKLINRYYNEFRDNSWNMPKILASVITYIIVRLLNEVSLMDVFDLLQRLVQPHEILPLLQYLTKEKTLVNTIKCGVKLFDYEYVKNMFSICRPKGKRLIEKLLKQFQENYRKMKTNELNTKYIPFDMNEYLGIKKKKLPETLENEQLDDMQIAEIAEIHPPFKEPFGAPLVNYIRLLDLSVEESVPDVVVDDMEGNIISNELSAWRTDERSKSGHLKSRDSLFESGIYLEKKDGFFERISQEYKSLVASSFKARILKEQMVQTILTKFKRQPWALTKRERRVVEKIKTQVDNIFEEDDKDLYQQLQFSERKAQMQMGTKNRCCVHELEKSHKYQPEIYKRNYNPIDSLRQMVDFRKNNAFILREAANLSKEETCALTEFKELEGGDAGIFEFNRKLLEREVQDEGAKVFALKKSRLTALLTLEKALLAKQRLKEQNEEKRKLFDEEKRELDELKMLLQEEEEIKNKKLIEDIHQIKEKVKNNLTMLHLDNWVEARYVTEKLQEMKNEKKQQMEEELNMKRVNIGVNKIYHQLNQKGGFFDNPMGGDPFLKMQQTSIPSVAEHVEREIAKSRKQDELKKKQDFAVKTIAQRNSLRKCAEEFINNKRKEKQNNIKMCGKKIDFDITIKSEELDDLENQLKILKQSRKAKYLPNKVISSEICGQKNIKKTQLVNNYYCLEIDGMLVRNIRKPKRFIVESKKLKEILDDYDVKKNIKPVLKIEKQVDLTDKIITKVPAVITSLDTFFTNLFSLLNWEGENEPTTADLIEKKIEILGKIYMEWKLVQESDPFIESNLTIPKPAEHETSLLSNLLPVYLYRLNEGLVIRKPLSKDKLVVPNEILDKMFEVLEYYTKIGKQIYISSRGRKKSPSYETLEDGMDISYYQTRRFKLIVDEKKQNDELIGKKKLSSLKQKKKEIYSLTSTSSLKEEDNRGLADSIIERYSLAEHHHKKYILTPDQINFNKELTALLTFKSEENAGDEVDEEELRKQYDDVLLALKISLKHPDIDVTKSSASLLTKSASNIIIDREIIKIPSSTIIDDYYKKKLLESRTMKLEGKIVTKNIGIQSHGVAVKKLRKFHAKVSTYSKRSRRKNLSILDVDHKFIKPLKYVKSDWNDYFRRHIKGQTLLQRNSFKPVIYPPFKLNLSKERLEKLAIDPLYRIRGRRIIIPGKCRYVSQSIKTDKTPLKITRKSMKLTPSKTKLINCIRDKFNNMDECLRKKFPPPYPAHSVVLEHFPTLKEDEDKKLHSILLQSSNQRSSFSKNENLNRTTLFKGNISLPSPLGSRSSRDEKLINVSQTSKNLYTSMINNSYGTLTNKSSLIGEITSNDNNRTINNNNGAEVNTDLKSNTFTTRYQKLNACSTQQINNMKNSMTVECFRYFSLPYLQNKNSCTPLVNENKSFLPKIEQKKKKSNKSNSGHELHLPSLRSDGKGIISRNIQNLSAATTSYTNKKQK